MRYFPLFHHSFIPPFLHSSIHLFLQYCTLHALQNGLPWSAYSVESRGESKPASEPACTGHRTDLIEPYGWPIRRRQHPSPTSTRLGFLIDAIDIPIPIPIPPYPIPIPSPIPIPIAIPIAIAITLALLLLQSIAYRGARHSGSSAKDARLISASVKRCPRMMGALVNIGRLHSFLRSSTTPATGRIPHQAPWHLASARASAPASAPASSSQAVSS